VIGKFPLFGVGPGNFVTFINDFRFIQPVHNIFLLIFSESGLFSFVFFVLIMALATKQSLTKGYFSLFLISLLQVTFEGSLDHYFWTIHQTLLLMWLLLGLVFSGNATRNFKNPG
jgi:O-antigen ligase